MNLSDTKVMLLVEINITNSITRTIKFNDTTVIDKFRDKLMIVWLEEEMWGRYMIKDELILEDMIKIWEWINEEMIIIWILEWKKEKMIIMASNQFGMKELINLKPTSQIEILEKLELLDMINMLLECKSMKTNQESQIRDHIIKWMLIITKWIMIQLKGK